MKTGPKPISLEERFWKKVTKTSTCWLWTGATASNYGTIGTGGRDGRQINAHRVSYELAHGKFDSSLYVLHKCDNPICVNPSHLFLGTPQDNVTDMINKGRKVIGYLSGKNHHNFGKRMSNEQKDVIAKANSKSFDIRTPEGKIIHGTNLTKFCRENNLNQGAMWQVINGMVSHHHGYTNL